MTVPVEQIDRFGILFLGDVDGKTPNSAVRESEDIEIDMEARFHSWHLFEFHRIDARVKSVLPEELFVGSRSVSMNS